MNVRDEVHFLIRKELGIGGNIDRIAEITAQTHDDSTHTFTPEGEILVCRICGWIHPEQKAFCGHHTLRQHAEGLHFKLQEAGAMEYVNILVPVAIIKIKF
jgi:hypothetical protein